MGCDRGESDDLTQEAFLSVLRRPLQQRSRRETAAYLRIVARRQLLMLRRRQGREPRAVDLELADDVWAGATRAGRLNDYLDALHDCLQAAVNPRVRTALNLQYAEGASRQQIADDLSMTTDGVKTMLRRARQALRECIGRKIKS